MNLEENQTLIFAINTLFGLRLRGYREEKNLTQKQMAKMIMVAESTYANWEQGRREPNLLAIVAIKNALEITFDELLDFEKYPLLTKTNKK